MMQNYLDLAIYCFLGKKLGSIRPVLVMTLGILDRTGELVALRRKVVGVNDVMGDFVTVLLCVHLFLSDLGDGRLLFRV